MSGWAMQRPVWLDHAWIDLPAASISLFTSRLSYTHTPLIFFAIPLSFLPQTDPDPSEAIPMGEGFLSFGILAMRIGLMEFSGPVDVYFGIYAPTVDAEVFILRADNTLQRLSDGLVPWKSTTMGPIDESLFGTVSLSTLPPDTYTFYLLVTPAGSTASYYLWSTSLQVSP
jgi:hypothetical protein